MYKIFILFMNYQLQSYWKEIDLPIYDKLFKHDYNNFHQNHYLRYATFFDLGELIKVVLSKFKVKKEAN